jgi:hypothetical protein
LNRIARFLRSLADAISRPADNPLEFIATLELADEICRRSDEAFVFWGRFSKAPTPGETVDGHSETRFRTETGAVFCLVETVIDEVTEGR